MCGWSIDLPFIGCHFHSFPKGEYVSSFSPNSLSFKRKAKGNLSELLITLQNPWNISFPSYLRTFPNILLRLYLDFKGHVLRPVLISPEVLQSHCWWKPLPSYMTDWEVLKVFAVASPIESPPVLNLVCLGPVVEWTIELGSSLFSHLEVFQLIVKELILKTNCSDEVISQMIYNYIYKWLIEKLWGFPKLHCCKHQDRAQTRVRSPRALNARCPICTLVNRLPLNVPHVREHCKCFLNF